MHLPISVRALLASAVACSGLVFSPAFAHGHTPRPQHSAPAPAPAKAPAAAPAPGPVATPKAAVAGSLEYAPPVLSAPQTVTVPLAGAALKLSQTQDYIVKFPSSPVTGSVSIWGGRNVVIQGGDIRAVGKLNLKVQYWTGNLHVEGLHLGALDGSSTEGIDVDGRAMVSGAKAVFENIHDESFTGSYSTNHSDAIQDWAGAAGTEVIYSRIYAPAVQYQALMWQPAQFGVDPTVWRIHDCVFDKTEGTGGYLIFKGSNTTPEDIQNTWLVTNHPSSNGYYPTSQAAQYAGLHIVPQGDASIPAKSSVLVGTPGASYVSPVPAS